MSSDDDPATRSPTTLDPQDWDAFRARAHAMLERALDKMETATEGRAWTPVPDDLKRTLEARLPSDGTSADKVDARLSRLLPHGVGNTHPRFFGWVHGSGTPNGIIAEMVAAAMNANAGGRDHAAIYVERQLVGWVKALFGFPDAASGLVVSGTSAATIIALKVARDRALGAAAREVGLAGAPLVAYASEQAHSCVARALDLLGIGKDALRRIPTGADFRMRPSALRQAISEDRAAGLQPFAIVGSAGTVNTGAIDPLEVLAEISRGEQLWFHVDGAFGACGMLSKTLAPKLAGISAADSLAFDFHKWLHVNYDAGFVLVRDGALHRAAFSDRPDYLKGVERGLAAGNPWPVEYGPELSRGFRALKIWAQLMEHGPDKLGAAISENCEQAKQLAALVDAHPALEQMAPVETSICCFRFKPEVLVDDVDALNEEIVIRLQESGLAAPSTTRLGGELCIRVNITNHRTRRSDLSLLVDAVVETGGAIAAEKPSSG